MAEADSSKRNEALFRAANEEIARARNELGVFDGKTPFLCECEDATCRTIVPLNVDEYDEVRADSARFVVVPGHGISTGEVVADRGDYAIVERQMDVQGHHHRGRAA